MADSGRLMRSSFPDEEYAGQSADSKGKSNTTAGSGGKDSANATVRNLAGFRVRVVRPTGDKRHRADPFSVQVNSGNVFIVEAVWNKEYVDELRFFGFGKHDDQVDGSSGAFNLITDVPTVGAF